MCKNQGGGGGGGVGVIVMRIRKQCLHIKANLSKIVIKKKTTPKKTQIIRLLIFLINSIKSKVEFFFFFL